MSKKITSHVVEEGQTLSDISDLYGLSINDLLLLNGELFYLEDVENLTEGIILKVHKPEGFYQMISQGSETPTPTPTSSPSYGCADVSACNFDPDVQVHLQSACEYTSCLDCAGAPYGWNICGCTISTATNYNQYATWDDGSCILPTPTPYTPTPSQTETDTCPPNHHLECAEFNSGNFSSQDAAGCDCKEDDHWIEYNVRMCSSQGDNLFSQQYGNQACKMQTEASQSTTDSIRRNIGYLWTGGIGFGQGETKPFKTSYNGNFSAGVYCSDGVGWYGFQVQKRYGTEREWSEVRKTVRDSGPLVNHCKDCYCNGGGGGGGRGGGGGGGTGGGGGGWPWPPVPAWPPRPQNWPQPQTPPPEGCSAESCGVDSNGNCLFLDFCN